MGYSVKDPSDQDLIFLYNTNLLLRSMNIGPMLDEKLAVKYTTGCDEVERRRKIKRKEKFQLQVAKAVKRMQVTMRSTQLPEKAYLIASLTHRKSRHFDM